MFHTLMAVELIVRDLATCTAFYRDTLELEMRESESTSNSISFQIDNVYFFLLEAEGAAQMASSEPLDFSLEGSPRVLLFGTLVTVRPVHRQQVLVSERVAVQAAVAVAPFALLRPTPSRFTVRTTSGVPIKDGSCAHAWQHPTHLLYSSSKEQRNSIRAAII